MRQDKVHKYSRQLEYSEKPRDDGFALTSSARSWLVEVLAFLGEDLPWLAVMN